MSGEPILRSYAEPGPQGVCAERKGSGRRTCRRRVADQFSASAMVARSAALYVRVVGRAQPQILKVASCMLSGVRAEIGRPAGSDI